MKNLIILLSLFVSVNAAAQTKTQIQRAVLAKTVYYTASQLAQVSDDSVNVIYTTFLDMRIPGFIAAANRVSTLLGINSIDPANDWQPSHQTVSARAKSAKYFKRKIEDARVLAIRQSSRVQEPARRKYILDVLEFEGETQEDYNTFINLVKSYLQ